MSTPVHFSINTVDLVPPPTADLAWFVNSVKVVGGGYYFASPDDCSFVSDPSGIIKKYKARFASSRRQGWINKTQAEQLWQWFTDDAVLTVDTNITIPALVNHNMKFDRKVSKPLKLMRVNQGGDWWMYDMSLVSV